MRSSFGRFGMLKTRNFLGQHFVPDLLGRCKTGLPLAGMKANELIAKHVVYDEFYLSR